MRRAVILPSLCFRKTDSVRFTGAIKTCIISVAGIRSDGCKFRFQNVSHFSSEGMDGTSLKPARAVKNSRLEIRKFLVLTKVVRFNLPGNSLV